MNGNIRFPRLPRGSEKGTKRPADMMARGVGVENLREKSRDGGPTRKEREDPNPAGRTYNPLTSSSLQSLGQDFAPAASPQALPKASNAGNRNSLESHAVAGPSNTPSATGKGQRESGAEHKVKFSVTATPGAHDAPTASQRGDGQKEVDIVRPGSEEDTSYAAIWATLDTIGPRFMKEGSDMKNVFYMCTFRGSSRTCFVHKTLLREFAPQKLIDFYDTRLRVKKKSR